jgi:hypothetical protein
MLRVLTRNPIRKGAQFPPVSQRSRLDDYNAFYGLFMGTHSDVYEELVKKIEPTRRGNIWICVNLPRIISNVWADMLFGEPPLFVSKNKEQQKFLDLITQDGSVFSHMHRWAVDVSRYGDGIVRIIKKGKQKLGFMVQPPEYWYPVVSPRDIKEPIEHVFAWRYQDDSEDALNISGEWHVLYDSFGKLTFIDENGGEQSGNVILTSGQYGLSSANGQLTNIERTFNENQDTNIDEFPLVHVSNFDSSDSLFGISDLETVDSALSEVENRLSQISTILDKHASPNMEGPNNLIIRDANGENPHVDMSGSYFGLEPDDKEVSYVTWDGQLAAAYEEIKEMWNFIMKTAEISPALFGGEFGRAESGSAMKRLLLQTIIKVNRMRLSFNPAIKKLFKLYSQVAMKMNIPDATLLDSFDIQWRDGLPQDALEEVQAETMAVTGGIASIESAVSRAWNLQGEELVRELDKIDEDKKDKKEMETPVESPFTGGKTMRLNDIKSTLKEKPMNPSGKNI